MSGIDEVILPPCSRCGAKNNWYEVYDLKGSNLCSIVNERTETYGDGISVSKAAFEADNNDWCSHTKDNEDGYDSIRLVTCYECNSNYTVADKEYAMFLAVIKKHLRTWSE